MATLILKCTPNSLGSIAIQIGAENSKMKIVDNFENAVRYHEMKGAMHPEDNELIELQYKIAKKGLIDYIKKLKIEKQTAIDNESRLRYPDRTGQ